MPDTTVFSESPSTGLVLSGGGAKGAYQVGVLRALTELDIRVDMVAGASIGALNGAVLACAPSLPVGVQRLEELWIRLSKESPLQTNTPVYFKMLAAAGLTLGTPLLSKLLITLGAKSSDSLLSDQPLKRLIDEYLDIEGLMRGIPLYVSVYETLGGMTDILRCVLADTGLVDTPPSDFMHVQALPDDERKDALLASAALPLLYQARQIGGKNYTDGGQGGWQTSQGNTPIAPLVKAGCQQVIVTHLSDGSLWSRHNFPNTTILEIRPQTNITQGSELKALLGFDGASITRLMEQGYHDTLHCIGRVTKASNSRKALQHSQLLLDSSLKRGINQDADLLNAMEKIRLSNQNSPNKFIAASEISTNEK